MSTLIAEKNFVVAASRERVWRLIGKVIFGILPGLEKVEILDENSFRAILRMKVLGVRWSMKVRGEMMDVLPPEFFSVKLFIESPGGLFAMGQKVTLAMAIVDESQTEVACKAMAGSMGIPFRVLLLGQARRFARSTFEAIENRLKELA
jgi:carbon monoxide dehydrogenase subunit G